MKAMPVSLSPNPSPETKAGSLKQSQREGHLDQVTTGTDTDNHASP